jgi:hypothetical protein
MKPDQHITLEQLEQARPLRPDRHDDDFFAHETRTLECLREAGPQGYSNAELRERGCGERPSNRVCALRKKAYLIKTDRSTYPARFVLLRDANGNKSASFSEGPPDPRSSESDYMRRARQEEIAALPLFGARP